jgi:hypothetical protein
MASALLSPWLEAGVWNQRFRVVKLVLRCLSSDIYTTETLFVREKKKQESLASTRVELIDLLAGLGALFLVRTPIAALALHRAIADAATAIAEFQSTGDMRLRFSAEMARLDT